MRELETSLQQFGEFLLKAQLVKEQAAPHCVRRVQASAQDAEPRSGGWPALGRSGGRPKPNTRPPGPLLPSGGSGKAC